MTEKELLDAAISNVRDTMGNDYDNVFEASNATSINGFANDALEFINENCRCNHGDDLTAYGQHILGILEVIIGEYDLLDQAQDAETDTMLDALVGI